jgi:hypothetical protein
MDMVINYARQEPSAFSVYNLIGLNLRNIVCIDSGNIFTVNEQRSFTYLSFIDDCGIFDEGLTHESFQAVISDGIISNGFIQI